MSPNTTKAEDAAKGATPEEALSDPTPVNRETGIILATPPKHLQGLHIITDMQDLLESSIERIMNAPTPEIALADPESLGLENVVGDTITILRVNGIVPSAIAGREDDYYIVFDAEHNGEVKAFSTGSMFASARIAKCHFEGWLPRTVRVVQLESARNRGQSSLWIVDAEPTVAASEQGESF